MCQYDRPIRVSTLSTTYVCMHLICLKVNGLEVLKALESSKITLDVLTKTKIGMTVNNYRKSSNSTAETVALSKQLIKNWKKLLPPGRVYV